ncbi:MAG: hypothetical protein VX850_06045, partial [Gemmatimonadota bacterium]|nr:hypothetical protein [Gemmatimonadota bacterium]
ILHPPDIPMPGISDWACSGLAKTAAVTTVRQYLATLMIGVGGGGHHGPLPWHGRRLQGLGFSKRQWR